MVFVIGDLVCTVMILVGLVAVLFLLLVPKVVEWRRHGGDSRRLLVVLMSVLIVLVAGYTTWLVLDYREWTESRTLDYSVNITAPEGAIGVVTVPVTVNADLRQALEASPGASFEIVDTEHGEGLRITYRGSASVSGHLEWREEFDPYRLTMFERSAAPGVHVYWFHHEAGTGSNGTVDVEFRMVHNSIYVRESYLADLTLEEGWSEREVMGEYQEWYYG